MINLIARLGGITDPGLEVLDRARDYLETMFDDKPDDCSTDYSNDRSGYEPNHKED